VFLIDLDKYMKGIDAFNKNPTQFLYDGMHATDKGSKLYARFIADSLKEHFQNK